MRRFTWAAAALLLAILMVLGLGCSTDKGPGPVPGGGEPASVLIFMPTDTLTFLPGDSASCDGWVVVTDGSGRVMPNQEVAITLLEPFGSVELLNGTDSTDVAGRVYFRFRSYNQTGVTTVRAAVNNKVDLWPLTVLPARTWVARLNILLSKRQLAVARQFEDSVMVTCTISDSANQGVAGIILPLRCDGGRLAPIGPTDATGKASTYWYSNGQYGIFRIWVAIDTLMSIDSVQVDTLSGQLGTLEMTTPTQEIRADGGITFSVLTVTLKDQFGSAIIGDTIKFSAPEYGQVMTGIVTDAFGVALSTFQSTVPSMGLDDSAMVIARYPRLGLADTVNIHVGPAAEVNSLTITMSPDRGVAGVDTARITVRAFYSDGSAIHGMPVVFSSTCGQTAVDTLDHGSASFTWKYCNEVPEGMEVAKVFATVLGTSVSDTALPEIVAGPPRNLEMTVSPEAITIGETANVWAIVTDSLGNKVGANAATVVFQTTLGTVSPLMVGTNSQGRAECTLSPSTAAGDAIVTAMTLDSTASDSKLLIIRANSASSIRLTVSNPSPQVTGTGGASQSMLMAEVFDANENHVQDGQIVTFEITSQPRQAQGGSGCTINNTNTTIDQAVTAGGFARATFNAGWLSGPVVIKATAFTSPPPPQLADTLIATSPSISIVAGPPKHIVIQATNDAIDADAADAAWTVPLIAMVSDSFANPVGDHIAVFFSLLHGVGDDTASIQSDTVYTGNGPGRPGTAFGALRYIAAATNEHVGINAETGGEHPVTAYLDYVLPLQAPTINLYLLPGGSWHFGATVNGNPSHIECMALVRDGFRVPVNKVNVIYSTTRGRLWNDYDGTDGPWSQRLTGPRFPGDDDEMFAPGHTVLWMVETMANIFGASTAPEITGDVTVQVEGYPEAIDSETYNFRR